MPSHGRELRCAPFPPVKGYTSKNYEDFQDNQEPFKG